MSQRSLPIFIKIFTCATALLCPVLASADAFMARSQPGLSGNLGLGYELGQLGNDGLSLPDRTMYSFSISALPGYRFGSLLLGADVEYSHIRQYTALEDAGGTNLRGSRYLLGLGANYIVSKEWSVQGAVHFLGEHDLQNATDNGKEDRLQEPLGVRLKSQHFFFNDSQFSVDFGVQYVSYRALEISGSDLKSQTNHWAGSLGVTYHFGSVGSSATTEPAENHQASSSTPAPVAASPTPPPVEATSKPSLAELSQIVDLKQTAKGAMMNLSGDISFAPYSAELSPAAKDLLSKAAKAFAGNGQSNQFKVRVEGYTDTSGNKAKNYQISKARAENVKRALIEYGVPAASISAEGFGPEKPVADNKTKEGRSQNRRVEVYIADGK